MPCKTVHHYGGVVTLFSLLPHPLAPPATSSCRVFAEVTSDANLTRSLMAVYPNMSDIDPWVGALAEDHVYE